MFNTVAFNKQAFNSRISILQLSHIIVESYHEMGAAEINRSYIIGEDSNGAAAIGTTINEADIDLVGERLEIQYEPAISNVTIANGIAIAILTKIRLNEKRGRIKIQPHCGLELWDAFRITDTNTNQSYNYRTASYIMEYVVGQVIYCQSIELTNV